MQTDSNACADDRPGLDAFPPERSPRGSRRFEQFVVIDLCCGLGGISLAAKSLGIKPILGVDINKSALRTFSENFRGIATIDGDVASPETIAGCLRTRDLPQNKTRRLLVVSGPPCQGFSMAGPRNPADPRNDVLINVARAIVKLTPEAALIENVATVLSEKHSSRIRTLKCILSGAGYYNHCVTIDAQNHGVPQRRKRVFFFVSKYPIDKVALEESIVRCRSPRFCVADAFKGLTKPKVRPDTYSDDLELPPFFNHFSMRHSPEVKKKIASLAPGTGPLSYRKLDPARPAATLISGNRAPPAHYAEARSITVREAARLQGFPDAFRIYGTFASQMQQVTNAVPPPMAVVALRTLVEQLPERVCHQ